MDQQKIGAFLKVLRKQKGLTQEQIAEKFNVSSRTVSRWENGNNMPDLDVLIEYNNSELREDNLFNLLNDIEEPLIINDVRVDFNPINIERSGYNIKSWLEENYDYNKYIEEEEDEL